MNAYNQAISVVGFIVIIISLNVYANPSFGQNGNANPGNSGQAQNPNQEILERLDALEQKIDDLAGEQITATFCISQGREFGLAADWLFKAAAEVEGGVGWAEVFSGEGTAELKFPFGPMPSEFAIGGGASHGRGFDICIDLPIELGDQDTALLAELAIDINAKADDFPNRGKFQRRSHRLLNYTKRRVPGIQVRTDNDPQPMSSVIAADSGEGSDDEFDIIDEAIDNLLDGGLQTSTDDVFGVLRNQDVRNLAGSFDGLPSDITSVVNDPELLFDPLSDALEGGIDDMDCTTFGLDAELRGSKPGLDRFCERLESFPDYAMVEQVLSGSLIADLYGALDTLTITDSASEVAGTAKTRFCATAIGQRDRYASFCGR